LSYAKKYRNNNLSNHWTRSLDDAFVDRFGRSARASHSRPTAEDPHCAAGSGIVVLLCFLSFCFLSFGSSVLLLVSSSLVWYGLVSSHVQPLRLPQVRQDVDQLGQWNVLRKPRGSPRCVPWCAPPPPRIKEDVNDGVDVDRDGRPERGCRRGCRRRRRSSAAAIAMGIGETAPLPPGLLPPEESIVDKGLLQRRRCRRWFCRCCCLCHRPCLDGFCGERSGVDVNRLGLSGRRIGLIFLFAR